MKLLNSILLALDFSENNKPVVDKAIVLAKAFESHIIMVHVIPNLIEDSSIKDLIKEDVNTRIAALKDLILNSGAEKVETIVLEGDVVEKIIELAEYKDVNLILAGTTGTKDKKVIGTVSGKLVRRSIKPVWLVDINKEDPKSREILVPVDFSDVSARALRNAVFLAKKFKSRLHVIHVIDDVSYRVYNIRNELSKKDYAEKLDNFVKGYDFSDIDVVKNIVEGEPGGEIKKYIATEKVDLMVIGSKGLSRTSYSMIGSVAEKAIKTLPCSVLTVKEEDPISIKMELELHDVELCTTQGNNLMEHGALDEAIIHYKHCLNIDPLYSRGWKNLAKAYEKKGETYLAEEARQRADDIEYRLWSRKVESDVRKTYDLK